MEKTDTPSRISGAFLILAFCSFAGILASIAYSGYVAIAIGISRWLRDIDRSLYDAGISPPGRQLCQPSGTQYFGAVTAVGVPDRVA